MPFREARRDSRWPFSSVTTLLSRCSGAQRIFYANKWVLSHKYCENTDEHIGRVSAILDSVLELLPIGEKAGRVIPASFYFSLLSRSMSLSLTNENRKRLQDQFAPLLHLARIEDFLLPDNRAYSITSTPEFEAMERIVSIHTSANRSEACSTVAELWDCYLSQVAMDPKLEPCRFMDLVEIVPMEDRALNTFLVEHPQLSSEEKASVCKYLNCQKLTQEICIEAVHNDLMPLRLIVQALFVQHLQTHRAFKECSGSFRYVNCGEITGNLSSQNLEESPLKQTTEEEEATIGKTEYESTSFRLQALEQELVSLKQSLQWQNVSKGSDRLALRPEKRNAIGQARRCIGSMSWANHRSYASRLLKVFRRITLLGKGKSKIKKSASGTSSSSFACRSKTLHEMH